MSSASARCEFSEWEIFGSLTNLRSRERWGQLYRKPHLEASGHVIAPQHRQKVHDAQRAKQWRLLRITTLSSVTSAILVNGVVAH